MATYNGDAFDFPFVYARAAIHGLDMFKEIGFTRTRNPNSDLGLASHGLFQVGQTLQSIELDPELMTPYAVEQPQTLAQYSVSDAVATYYLYMKYVHPFIFSLCNIIPLNLTKSYGKALVPCAKRFLWVFYSRSMYALDSKVEAFNSGIIMPNRHTDPHGTMYNGHLLESETYVGGHVEALEAGVFRSDILSDFKLVPSRCQKLIDELDSALKFAIVDEGQHALEDVLNYDEVRAAIQDSLETMRDVPDRQEFPLIYHLDVAAMYPNIMLSNRLQPDSVWSWRGEYFPAKLDEYKMIRNAIESEVFPPKKPGLPPRKFGDLAPAEQTTLLHKRLGDYSRKVYRKTHETRIEVKEAIICQQENPFYIDTVRAFRDRRYTYKGLHKTWKKRPTKRSKRLAHKCILNSFYGYVMRKIIQAAREIIDEVGRPLELDTDGIWCMLPKIFPDNYTFKLANGKTFQSTILIYQRSVHQLNPETKTYDVRSENSIFFELDATQKRYAVFNPDGSLAELKGFEVKRRGELQLIKIFQTAIFEKFLLGDDLKACYDAVAQVANRWLDVLASKAHVQTLAEYGAQKSTSIRTAKRLSEFLGNQMVKDKGLSCRFIISAKPHGAPVTDRAVPVAIFSAEPSVQRHFLRKWLKDNSLVDLSLRSILDWGYYTERLGSVIQKIHHPDWLARRLATREDTFKQHKIDEMFARQAPLSAEELEALRASKQRKADALARKEPPKLPPHPSHPFTIASMLHVQSFKAASHSSHLELIQLLPNLLKPGEFQGWVLFNDFIQTVRIVVLREFYVNLKHEPGPDFFPESCVVEPVIKTLPRSQVRLNLFKISVPEKSYIEDAAHYQKMATSRRLKECTSSTESPNGNTRSWQAVRYVLAYHFQSGSRHAVGIFNPNGAAQIFITDRSPVPQVPNLQKYYKNVFTARAQHINNGAGVFDSEALSRELALLKGQKTGPGYVLVIHSMRDLSYYQEKVLSISKYPAIMIHSSHADNKFEALRVIQAEQFNVPVGNFEADASRNLMDLEFARKLNRADHLLWWSPSQKPDLGSKEDDLNSELVMDLTIGDLAINSVSQSSWVYEISGTGGSLGFQTLRTPWTNMPKARHYSGLIKHFWRWLSSSSSCMFDPALYRFVHGLMKKVFSQLLAEFRRLGTRIIFADFGRIFLLTTKPNSASALAYASYIVTAINGRDLFKMLDLNIVRFWEQLLWIDATNFAGITCALQQDFLRVVCLYVHDLYQCHNQANSSNQVQLEVDRKQVEAELLRSLVNSKITRQTLQIVNQIIKRQNNAAADPELRAAFDFLDYQMVCFVMELATFVTSEVRIMKRVLLDLIGVREFSNEAVFKNPCIPFKIPDTICQHCSAVRSFDLSRDPDLLASASSRRVGQPPEWLCGHCGHPYDRLGIEAMLIEQLHKQVASFQLQDLRCSRCSQLKEDTMSLRCPCSGEYLLAGDAGSQTDRPSTAHLKRRLAVARSVAEAHQLDVLLEFVEWLNSQIS
ncbi:hypothetical protein KEM48_010300 [Puccinia striiformis f. sp. tritici PST-130]|nr:hypothetical protein KEM48_010300 [Puccinia striiformis f. sp. tritici PST-130]